MKVLIACEESQTVCKAFRALGHEAYSCDVQEPSGARKVSSKYTLTSNRNSKIRAKTFHGIAAAMAAQWGGDIR